MRLFQRAIYVITAVVCFLVATCAGDDKKRSFTIFNESGCRVEINWINPDTNERVLQSSPFIYAGATFDLNSYVTHRFEAKELPSKKTGDCKNGAEGPANPKLCGLAFFTVNENFDQVFYIREGLHIQHDDNHSLALTRASGLLTECQKDTLAVASDADTDHREMVADMARCIEENLRLELQKSNEEHGFQSAVRLDMAELLSTYACADVKMKGTETAKEETWRSKWGTKTVNILHDRPGSKVHVIKDFVSREDCKAMEKGLPTFGGSMRAASSVDLPSPNVDGVRILEEDIQIPWDEEAERNPVAAVSRRILDYTDHVLHLSIDEHGQEGLTSIQYASTPSHPNIPSVTSETRTERYEPVDNTPHCGKNCSGKPHRVGQRIAAVVMYCEVPGKESGGATNFRKSGAHHVPQKYSAMFFSYMDPKSFRMDADGYTEHTDCPVLKGEKRIIKQWIRHGVHKDNPWDLFEHETAEITKIIMEEDDEQEL